MKRTIKPNQTESLEYDNGLRRQVDQEGDKPPLKYSQTFVLMPLNGGAGWWVYNDIFRLNYG